MILGIWHWGGSGGDYVEVHSSHDFIVSRHEEIVQLSRRLARFRPTCMAVEVRSHVESALSHQFQQFLDGQLILSKNEVHQIAFRVARDSGVDTIRGVDWHSDQHIPWDGLFDAARSRGEGAQLDLILERVIQRSRRIAIDLEKGSISDVLLNVNSRVHLREELSTYANLALLNVGGDPSGAHVVARWYERNIMIFSSIAQLLTQPDDRVLVIIGSAHVPILLHFLEGMDSVDVFPVETCLLPADQEG